MLNRVITYTGSGFEVEADPRHSEMIVEQLGVSGPGLQPEVDRMKRLRVLSKKRNSQTGTSLSSEELQPEQTTWGPIGPTCCMHQRKFAVR